MQQYGNGQKLYSPTDLVNFLGCRHASFLDVKALSEDMDKAQDSAIGQLLQKKGLEHEAAYLQQLKAENKTVVEIPRSSNLQQRNRRTLKAMQSGSDVIYQAVLFEPPWLSYADFLIKCDTESNLGEFSYEVLDTKLARTPEPKTHHAIVCLF